MMSVLAVRSLTEVLVSLGTNVIILIIAGVGLYVLLRFLLGFSNAIERANKRGDSRPAVFWCIVFFLIYWFWFR